MKMDCPYCGRRAELVDSAEVYHGKSYGLIYLCRPCDARVGVHKGTHRPLGRLANADLRKIKMKAHALFDPLWLHAPGNRQHMRNRAYAAMSDVLHIDRKFCHIGMFDEKQSERLILACEYGLIQDEMEQRAIRRQDKGPEREPAEQSWERR